MLDVCFTDENIGTVVGSTYWFLGNTILRTTDGGISWSSQISGTNLHLYNVFFTDANNGWAVGINGTILRTTNGGVTFIEDENNFTQPKEFLLKQNYPNPFNPSTKIKFTIPSNVNSQMSNVTLKVYDILGNEVTTLVNEEKPVGEFEVEFNGGGLPSGIYFYQLKAEWYIETRKMVLLK